MRIEDVNSELTAVPRPSIDALRIESGRAGISARAVSRGETAAPAAASSTIQPFKAFGSGIRRDVRAGLSCYAADWLEILNKDRRAVSRIAAATVYMGFCNVLDAIVLGENLQRRTGEKMHIPQVLVATAFTNVVQALVGGFPMLVYGMGVTTSIVYGILYDLSLKLDIDFYAFTGWSCVWASILLGGAAVFNLCSIVNLVTRFSMEVFGAFIAVSFLSSGIRGLEQEFSTDYLKEFITLAGDDASTLDPKDAKYLTTINGIFALLIAFLFVWTTITLVHAREWRIGSTVVRAILADYGPVFMLVILSGLSYAFPNGFEGVPVRINVQDPRSSAWIESAIYTPLRMGELEAKWIAAALIPGLILSILLAFSHTMTSKLGQQTDFNLKRPAAYHYDMLVLAFNTLVLGLVGLPPLFGILPQTPLHTQRLSAKEKGASETRGAIVGRPRYKVFENRISNLLQAMFCLVAVLFGHEILHFVPTSIISGFFIYLAIETVWRSQLWDRMQIVLTGPKRRWQWLKYSHALYLETVSFGAIVLFTVIQVACVAATVVVVQCGGPGGICFPIMIMALVPMRLYLLPRLFKQEFLKDLDADSAEVAAPIPASRSQSTNEDEDATILDPGTPLAGRYIVTLKHTVDGPMSSKASSPKVPQQMRGLTVSMLESLSGRDFDSPKRL